MTVFLLIFAAVAATAACCIVSNPARDRITAAWWRLAECVRPLPSLRYEGHHTPEAVVVQQWHDDHAEQLPALPWSDHLRPYIEDAWAATGTTQAQYWAHSLPGPSLPSSSRAGEPTNRSMGNWPMQHLERQWTDSTGSFKAISAADPEPVPSAVTPAEEYGGGDPYGGEGEHWFDVFDRITARAHEQLDKARADLLAGLGAR